MADTIPAAAAANMAQGALQFMQRADLKGGEVEAFTAVRSFLANVANGVYDLVPVAKPASISAAEPPAAE